MATLLDWLSAGLSEGSWDKHLQAQSMVCFPQQAPQHIYSTGSSFQ